MDRKQFIWVEQYRPRTIDECILPDNLKQTFNTLVEKGEIINMILSGGPGTGKTTVARALCETLGSDYIIINGSETRGIDMVRSQVGGFAGTVSTNGKPKVVILDEADYITPEAQAALRNLIESTSANCRYIMTCNFKHRIIAPLHSRTSVIDFDFTKKEIPQLAAGFAKRIVNILQQENVEYSMPSVLEVVKQYFPDNRRILNELQRYSNINGKIDSGVISILNSSKVSNLITFLKKGDFKSCRQFIADNPDPDNLFNDLYENMSEYVQDDSIPYLVLLLGEYQHKSAMCANQEINLAAFCVETIKSVKFR